MGINDIIQPTTKVKKKMINLISLIGLFVVIVCNIYIVAFVSFKKN